VGFVADLEVSQIGVVHVFDGRIGCNARQRVDAVLREVVPEAQFLVEAQHGLAAFEIGLHGDAFLHGGEARPAEETAETARSGRRALGLLDDEFAGVAYIGVATR
jgi:hypothetical protein